MTTQVDLDALEALEEKATGAPWVAGVMYWRAAVNDGTHKDWDAPRDIPQGRCAYCRGEPNPCSIVLPASDADGAIHVFRGSATIDRYNDDGDVIESAPDWHLIVSDASLKPIAGNYGYEEGGICSTREDSALIVALRNAAPALIEEIRTLRARVAQLEGASRG